MRKLVICTSLFQSYRRYIMYTRITNFGGRQYLQMVESFRNDSGKVRTRVIVNFGRLDQITPEKIDLSEALNLKTPN